MTEPDPALIEIDSTREAHERLYELIRQESAVSPEARATRSAIVLVANALLAREYRALDTDMPAREIQYLVDLRAATDQLLASSISNARTFSDLTWQTVGDLLGISRQAAWERYGKVLPPQGSDNDE